MNPAINQYKTDLLEQLRKRIADHLKAVEELRKMESDLLKELSNNQ
jgi:hypothetical protein